VSDKQQYLVARPGGQHRSNRSARLWRFSRASRRSATSARWSAATAGSWWSARTCATSSVRA